MSATRDALNQYLYSLVQDDERAETELDDLNEDMRRLSIKIRTLESRKAGNAYNREDVLESLKALNLTPAEEGEE